MDRLTRVIDDFYVVDDTKVQHDEKGHSGAAIDKLAKFENFYDDLISKQRQVFEEMEKLKSEGKNRSVKFKQLFADKLTNNNILILLKSYGLE